MAVNNTSSRAGTSCTRIPRFSVHENLCAFYMDVPQSGSLLAVSGRQKDTDETFIDLFMITTSPGLQQMLSPQPYHSELFPSKGTDKWRCVCLWGDSKFITSYDDTIESYDTKDCLVVERRKFTGEAHCMTVTSENLFVGLYDIPKVIMFDSKLNQMTTITLKGMGDRDWPDDITVTDNLFICTGYGKAFMYNNMGDMKHEYKAPNQQYKYAQSITGSKKSKLIYILWTCGVECLVVVYSIRAYKYFPSGCHFLASFKVPNDSCRIRINDKVHRLFVVTHKSGEVHERHTLDIVNPENRLSLLECLIAKDDCQGLLEYFKVPGDKAKIIITSHKPSRFLIQHLRETGVISAEDIKALVRACKSLEISKVVEAWRNYEEFERDRKQLEKKLELQTYLRQLNEKLKKSEDERQALFGNLKEKRYENKSLIDRLDAAEQEKREVTNKLQESNEEVGKLTTRLERVNGEKSLQINKLTEKLKISDDEKQKLIRTLETTEDKRMHCEEILVAKEMEMKEVKNRLTIDMEHHLKELEETKFMLRAANDELIKSQINYAKESMALQEVLEQTKKAVNDYEMQKERSLLNGKEISLLSEESTTLAADYGRFLVDVADDLTLDNTLTLATLLGLPQSEKDMLRRISLIETPGITLINSLKARNIINMYDVTNLQKGLMHLHLYSTNAKYLVPYQEKVDPFLFEDNQLEELLDWPETFTALKVPNIPQETKESKHGHLEEKSMEKIEREEISRPRQYSQQMHQPYMEQKINSGGGIITIMGVHLSIPSGALPTDHLIAITIIDDPNMPFLESYQRCRVTPLIKLEPEGLNLTKAAILTIPHSAFIPKPEGHGVSLNIFAGPVAQEESQKGWREDKSLKWKLDQETIRTEVKTLSYIFATLVSEGTEQQHRFRVVPLIDAILNVKDDAVITVCFCQDSAKEYKRLLDDHKSKLTLGNYTTFQVGRNLSKERDTESYLSISLSLQTGNYHLAKKEAIKSVHIDHLCAARSFSHDFRLKRVTDCGSTAMVHVTLKISHGENRKALNLQAKVNNILLSAKIQCQESPKNVEQYENMKENVSLLLDKYHCERLSTFFHLTPAEEKTLQTNENPGKVLMKTLEQRGLLMPNKVITLYESLNAINQSYIGRRVLDYIDTSKEKKSLEANCNEQEDTNVANEKGSGIQERNIALTKNAELLIKEGYIRLDVQRALKLSHGNLDLGRRLLLLAKYEHDRVPDCQESTLYREDFIDEHGGELYIAGIHVRVPAGALHVGRIVNLSVSTASECRGPIPNKSMRLTPFVKLGPEGLTFRKPVSMTVPHCALITNNQKDLDVYKGVTQKDKTMKWNLLERKNFPCSMNSSSLQIEIERACGFISPHIPYHREMKKRICVVPIMHRICSLSDALQICLWFHNDNKSEHEYLVNEVKNSNATPIHDPVSFQLKSTASTLPVRISSGTSQCSPRPRKLDIDTNSLWLQNRHKVEFQLQNKDSRDTINLEIESRLGVPRKCFFHIKVYVQIDKLLRSEQIIPPSQPVSPADCITAFKQLCQKLAEKLDEEQCSQLASTFQLSDHIPSRTEEFRKPGTLLLKTLVETSLISCSTISTFENALTNIGNEACAKLVRDFRKGNPVITQPIMCPELFSPLSQ